MPQVVNSRISRHEALATAGAGTIHFLLQLVRGDLHHVDPSLRQRVQEIGPGYARNLCSTALGDETSAVPIDRCSELDVPLQLVWGDRCNELGIPSGS